MTRAQRVAVVLDGNANGTSSSNDVTEFNFLNWVRILCLEIPLAALLGCLAVSNGAQYFYDTYYEPYMKSVKYDSQREQEEYTYYYRVCSANDFTADCLEDMIIAPNATDATDLAIRHGSAIIPGVVLPEHAQKMREHVLKRNSQITKDDVDYVRLISNPNRWSYKLDIDAHPSIEKVLQDIATNDQLTKTLEDLLGPDPALVELTAVTSAYGAGDQHFHKDNSMEMTFQHMARTWNDMYSVFIPLQDTTAEMGATDACPGFHICVDVDQFCNEETAIRMSDESRLWRAGDAWIFQGSTDHRGPAHTDPTGERRVILILTFMGRPGTIEDDRRIPSLDTSWSLKMEMSGLSLRDLARPRSEWNWFRKFAAWGGLRQHSFDYIQFSAIRIINYQFHYRTEDLEGHVARMNRKAMPDDGWFVRSWVALRGAVFGGKAPTEPRSRDNVFKPRDLVEIDVDEEWEAGIIHKRVDEHTYVVWMQDSKEFITYDVLQICARGECSQFLAWKVYVERCLERMRSGSWSAVRYLSGVHFLLLVITCRAAPDGRSLLSVLNGSFIRLVLFSMPLWGGATLWLYRVQQSQWGKDVTSGHVFDRPYMDPNIASHWQTPQALGPTIFPYRADVLVSTRLDSPGFGQRNFHLDITHPGNALWQGLIGQFAPAYSALPLLFQEAIIKQIHLEVARASGLILLQNNEGNWVYLSDLEARKYTRRRLHEAHSLLTATLMEGIRRLKSELQYGRNRETALYRIHTPLLVSRMEAAIYRETESSARTEFISAHTVPFFPTNSVLPSLPSSYSRRVPRYSRHLQELEGLPRFELDLGDLVVAHTGKMWLQGTITKVERKGATYDGDDSSIPIFYQITMQDGKRKRLPETLVRYQWPGTMIEGIILEEDGVLKRIAKVMAAGSNTMEAV